MKWVIKTNNKQITVAEKRIKKDGSEYIKLDPLVGSLFPDTKVITIDGESIVDNIQELEDYTLEFNSDQEIDNMPMSEYVEKNYIDKIEFSKRKSIFANMNSHISKEGDFIEVTRWTNGEGWDITISDEKTISLHETEFEVIKLLIDKLDKDE